MPHPQSALSALFSTPQPSAAQVPHLITHFDSELLHAVVRVNGAKLGAWPVPAPFGEDDRYEPYRENAPLSAWALALNQQHLLDLSPSVNSMIFGGDTLIVDATADEKTLAACDEQRGEEGYENLPDFPALLAKIGWALIPVDPEHDHALFLASPAKIEYVHLLMHWCHSRGRRYLTLAPLDDGLLLRASPAPPEAQARAAMEHAYQYVAKLAQFGIDPETAVVHLNEALKQMHDGGE
jgi:rRNA maturation protein Nop10